MATLIYGVQVNGPSKRKLNPAAAPIKRKTVNSPSKLTKICAANASFVKKKDFSTPVVEKQVIPEVVVEIPVPLVVEEPVIEVATVEETPVENAPKSDGWKAKREKKKIPYGLKENAESTVE
jgi:hypothetical protein